MWYIKAFFLTCPNYLPLVARGKGFLFCFCFNPYLCFLDYMSCPVVILTSVLSCCLLSTELFTNSKHFRNKFLSIIRALNTILLPVLVFPVIFLLACLLLKIYRYKTVIWIVRPVCSWGGYFLKWFWIGKKSYQSRYTRNTRKINETSPPLVAKIKPPGRKVNQPRELEVTDKQGGSGAISHVSLRRWDLSRALSRTDWRCEPPI